jgi:CRISPR system Cascade subunit CasB
MAREIDHPRPWAQTARRWWAELQGAEHKDASHRVGNPAALARLRRASSPTAAAEEPAVFDLYKRLGFGRHQIDRWLSRVAVVAAVLAHIRTDASATDSGHPRRFAEILGGNPPLMSPLRFKRLLAATHDQEILIVFRRAVALAGAKNISIEDVAASLLDWSDRRRMRWAFDYFGAGIAAPKFAETASTPIEDED